MGTKGRQRFSVKMMLIAITFSATFFCGMIKIFAKFFPGVLVYPNIINPPLVWIFGRQIAAILFVSTIYVNRGGPSGVFQTRLASEV